MAEKRNNDGFLLVILGSAAAAGVLYLIQEHWVDPWLSSRWASALFRTFRMSVVYVIPAIWWLRRRTQKSVFAELGISLPRERAPFILGTGILLY